MSNTEGDSETEILQSTQPPVNNRLKQSVLNFPLIASHSDAASSS